MAFPVIEASNTTADTSSASITVAMPASIVAGELLLVIVAQDVTGTLSATGWTKLEQTNDGASQCGLAIFAKIAAGSDTCTVTSTNSQDAAVVSLRISGHGVSDVSTDITRGTAATGASAAPDPPNCNPGSAKDYLWIECFGADDDDETTPYESTNYTAVAQLQSASSTSSCLVAVARRNLNASQENPGAMAMGLTEEWVAQTLAIPPDPNQTVTASGIGTTEAFTDSTITLFEEPAGLASLEAFGGATVSSAGADQDVTASGVGTAEAFGGDQLDRTLPVTAIDGLEAFGTSQLDRTLPTTGVESGETFGVAGIGLSVAPSAIDTLEAFGVSRLDFTLMLQAIASLEAFGGATVAAEGGDTTITAQAIGSAEAHGDTTVAPGPVTVSPNGIASLEAEGSLGLGMQVQATGVASGEAEGTAQLDMRVVAAAIASLEALGGVSVGQSISTTGIGTGETWSSPVVVPGAISVSPSSVGSQEGLGDAVITSGTLVQAQAIAGLEAFGAGSISITLPTTGVSSAEAFGGSTIVNTQAVLTSSVTTLEAFGGATVSLPQSLTILPDGIPTGEAFGISVITVSGQLVIVATLSSKVSVNPRLSSNVSLNPRLLSKVE